MSSMKGGFSTLNRWFGRKKDKSGVGNAASNGKLSKSTTQLHHLSTDTNMHINEASQLDYNRITPLPVATSNAPFEQTFRITVLLPKDQLYVARLGARVPLSKLLSLVCDNKQLDADKYEFRNPVDASQVYSCELTIGAVGLSEIRLCHKSESYDSFNADSMLKFQRTVAARDSLSSSSDFSSSRHSQSKLTLAKTPSPYSSSNSLNSMDSTGMNYTRTPVVPPKALAPPPRKKRVAPRPPSQLVIPEQSVAQFSAERDKDRGGEPAYAVIVKRPQLCMSTPNLASTPELETETEKELANELDCNGNSAKTLDGGHYATLEIKTNGNGNGNGNGGLPEPTPRKRLIQLKKKTAPAPPPDASLAMSADSISLASTTASISEMAPQPAPRITTPNPAPVTPSSPNPCVEQLPPPLPVSAAPQPSSNQNPSQNQNVSKVLLNRTPTPEPRSLSSANGEEEELEELEEEDNNDAVSKQADSGIGEPVATPLNSTSPSPEPEPEPDREKEKEHRKAQLESSSEDEEAIKVYNFKTSRETSLKMETEMEQKELQLPKATTLAELTVLTNAVAEEGATEEEEEEADKVASEQPTPNSASELTSLSSWNYAVPISPPPDFSDARSKERGNVVSGSPLDEIVDELSSIINQQRLDTLIRQAPEQPQIEAAKPNRLANFSIAAISNGGTTRSGSSSNSNSSSTATTPTTPKTITRADSFQAVGQSGLGLRLRSSSQLSLNKLEIGMGNGSGSASGSGGLHPRRSSSELSIAESPSLQSLELIKTILSNSRKNSLADSPDSPQPAQVHAQLETIVKPKKSPSPAPSPVSIAPATAAVPAPIPSPAPVASVRASPVEESSAQSVSPASTATPLTLPAFSPSPASPASFLESESKVASSTSTSVVALSLSPTPAPSPTPSPAAAAASSPAPSSSPTPAAAPVPAAKPLPPTYRYSGPPSINFATWSERPKSQVAIKNEGDYIFGGATVSPPAPPTKPVAAPAKLTIEIASPILRMGIPRKEYHVPITVKPLRDASEEFEREQQKREELPSKELLRETVQEPMRDSQRDLLRQPLREPQRDLVKPSTLPRPAKSNRFTLPAQAHSTLTSSTSTSTATSTTLMNVTSSNSLPRPMSTLERKTKAKESEPVAVPFGQNTLRRTGFKERMLAKELEEKEQALRVRVSVNGMATPTPSVPTTAVESNSMIIRSSKLELKLQQQQTEVAATPTGVTPKVATPEVATPEVATLKVATPEVATPEMAASRVTPEVATPMLQVKLRPTSQVAAKVATSSTTPPPPVAPPAPAKAKPMRNVGVAAPDPRTQLLDAIRNFKREELNRA